MRIILIVLLLGKLSVCLASTENEMLKAYQEQNFSKARKLARKIPKNPKARFVKALLLIYNSRSYAQGLAELKKLYQDKALPKSLWLQASLAYARVAQLMEKRPEVYGTLADSINSVEIYQELIKAAPKSRTACTAMLFKVADDLLSGDGQKEKQAFFQLENFCKNYKGSKQFLTPLHLLAEDRYIVLKKDYKSAMRHLKTAYKNGVVNPKDRAVVLYRIGRMYDMKLKNKKEAVKYYSEFMRKYPYSDNAPSVKRFLNKINNTLTGSQ